MTTESKSVEDREAIRDLVRCYAHCVRKKDLAGVIELFAEHASMDMGDRPPIVGREALREEYQKIFAGFDLEPSIYNHAIELCGDRATGSCDLDLRGTVGGKSVARAGSYEDEYIRVGGRWKFRSRKLTMK